MIERGLCRPENRTEDRMGAQATSDSRLRSRAQLKRDHNAQVGEPAARLQRAREAGPGSGRPPSRQSILGWLRPISQRLIGPSLRPRTPIGECDPNRAGAGLTAQNPRELQQQHSTRIVDPAVGTQGRIRRHEQDGITRGTGNLVHQMTGWFEVERLERHACQLKLPSEITPGCRVLLGLRNPGAQAGQVCEVGLGKRARKSPPLPEISG